MGKQTKKYAAISVGVGVLSTVLVAVCQNYKPSSILPVNGIGPNNKLPMIHRTRPENHQKPFDSNAHNGVASAMSNDIERVLNELQLVNGINRSIIERISTECHSLCRLIGDLNGNPRDVILVSRHTADVRRLIKKLDASHVRADAGLLHVQQFLSSCMTCAIQGTTCDMCR